MYVEWLRKALLFIGIESSVLLVCCTYPSLSTVNKEKNRTDLRASLRVDTRETQHITTNESLRKKMEDVQSKSVLYSRAGAFPGPLDWRRGCLAPIIASNSMALANLILSPLSHPLSMVTWSVAIATIKKMDLPRKSGGGFVLIRSTVCTQVVQSD